MSPGNHLAMIQYVAIATIHSANRRPVKGTVVGLELQFLCQPSPTMMLGRRSQCAHCINHTKLECSGRESLMRLTLKGQASRVRCKRSCKRKQVLDCMSKRHQYNA